LTLGNLNIGLGGSGALTFNANGAIAKSIITDVNSSATQAITFNGTTDSLTSSTVINDGATVGELLLVTPGASGTNNLISENTFVANGKTNFLVGYMPPAATTAKDQVMNNAFIGNKGTSIQQMVFVTGPLSGLTIQGNAFSDPDNGVIAIDVGGGATQSTQIIGNVINLTGASSTFGIAVFGGTANTTTTAVIANNVVNTNNAGEGLVFDLGATATSVLDAQVQGNDLHNNLIGFFVPASTTGSTASVAGIDLGGGSQGSLGGNNFRGFTAPATASAAAILISNAQSSTLTGALSAKLNSFATGVTPSTVVFATGSGATISVTSPLSANAAFVDALYNDFLGRAGNTSSNTDAGNWINLLNSGAATIASVANSIIGSAESLSRVVNGLYLKLLNRNADSGGLSNFVAMLQKGTSLEQVIAALMTSAEYDTRYGSRGAFVQSLFQVLLGRTGSGSEVAAWENNVSMLGRTAVINLFLQSSEFRTDVVRALFGFTPAPFASVASLFPNLLHRTSPPTAADVNAFVNSGLSIGGVVQAIASSNEFFQNG
jgi:hypothetical protein